MKIDISKLKRGDLLQIRHRHPGQPAVFIGSVQEKEAALLVVYLLGQYIVFDEHGVPQADDFSEHLDMDDGRIEFCGLTAFTHEWNTAAGLHVRIYATDTGGKRPVHGAVNYKTAAGWVSECWTILGKHLDDDNHPGDIVHNPSCGCLG